MKKPYKMFFKEGMFFGLDPGIPEFTVAVLMIFEKHHICYLLPDTLTCIMASMAVILKIIATLKIWLQKSHTHTHTLTSQK